MTMDNIKLWDRLENFAGDAAALIRDDGDLVHVSLCPPPGEDAPTPGTYALTDPEWIRWQAVIEAAPAMLAALKILSGEATVRLRQAAECFEEWAPERQKIEARWRPVLDAIAKAEEAA